MLEPNTLQSNPRGSALYKTWAIFVSEKWNDPRISEFTNSISVMSTKDLALRIVKDQFGVLAEVVLRQII